MHAIKGLYAVVVALFFVNLANMTLFNSEWNGITMWINTGLFIVGTAYFIVSKNASKPDQ